MLKRVHSLVMTAALLGLPGWVACESGRESPRPGERASGEPAAAESNSPGASYELQLIRSVDDLWDGTTEVDPALICQGGSCPTLEQALASTQCQGPPTAEASPTWWNHQYVVSGCGLTAVHRAGFGYTGYWYDSFGAPPVAVLRATDVGPPVWSQTRSIECPPGEQQTCAVCGDGFPVCGETSGWLPQPPPPPPGCDCTPEGDGSASVSLDCFCSIYPCPPLPQVVHDCDDEPGDRRVSQHRASENCGTVWFESDQRLGYDAQTGALVAAEASFVAPVALPCFTTRIVAGAAVAGADAGATCTTPRECDCNQSYDAQASSACKGTDWFDTLASRLPDDNPFGIVIEPRPDTPPHSPSVEVNGCHFEYLGDWVSCQQVGLIGERVEGASFDECLNACLARTDCSSVVDYHWLDRPDLGCYLFLSSCDAPATGVWQQEDGGRYYRKVCSGP